SAPFWFRFRQRRTHAKPAASTTAAKSNSAPTGRSINAPQYAARTAGIEVRLHEYDALLRTAESLSHAVSGQPPRLAACYRSVREPAARQTTPQLAGVGCGLWTGRSAGT